MDVHDRYLHLNQRPYTCDECGRSFIRSDDLRRHCRNHRNKEMNKGKHMCSLCGKQFNNTGQRLRHERFSHMDIRNHTCDNCGKKFHTQQQLKRYSFHNAGDFIFLTDIIYHQNVQFHNLQHYFPGTYEFILERNLINVQSVGNNLPKRVNLNPISISTPVLNQYVVLIVH